MALARLSVKVGRRGKGLAHALYVQRLAGYGRCSAVGETVAILESGNMPSWADEDPARFFEAADQYERANGSSYREMEIALPQELSIDQQQALIREFLEQEIGHRHPRRWMQRRPYGLLAASLCWPEFR